MRTPGSLWRTAALFTAVSILGLGALESAQVADARDGMQPAKAAKRVDKLLPKELASGDDSTETTSTGTPPAMADDETYLRRVMLDLVGELPSPEEITAFALDPSPDKRPVMVERLLADPRFGSNWGRYWRDVILFRRSDERALFVSASLEQYLTEQFNQNTPWDQIARGFITAKGNLAENGQTGVIAAQWGETSDVTAEMSRIFLGVQIQCAQCHDHPTDDWKREQFHQLAAFFPRVVIKAIRVDGKRTGFEVVGVDGRAKEHYMPDLEDPSAKGTLMQPVFFVSGEKLEPGSSDADRRDQLAGWMTDESTRWFSKAFVNRIWAELTGNGFYQPIDDLGPDRPCSAPKTLNLLSAQFVTNHYDVKWLFQTIMATQHYQRAVRTDTSAVAEDCEELCPQKLRGDQLFGALVAAVGIEDSSTDGRRLQRGPRTPRQFFNAVFGYDPSDPRDDVSGSIDQALMLMNSPVLARAIDGRSASTWLAKLLESELDDTAVIEEFYLRVLAREPQADEVSRCLDYVKQVGDRVEAFEDILWVLVNSTEFVHRR